jgi:hypothetical protein
MNRVSDHVKRYQSARARFLKPVISQFFARECPRVFGPVLREKIADELIALFETVAPETTHLRPGQLLWNALDVRTRADAPNPRYVPVVLTVINEDDCRLLAAGTTMTHVAERAVARMYREAYQQGGVLSARDIGLLRLRHPSRISETRRAYELNNDCVLPHTGALHDMGSTTTHKTIIIRKAVIEKKDPATVARETRHSQTAVDRYLKDYHRVKTLIQSGHDLDFIHLTTQIAKHVIKQYLRLIEEEKNDS